MESESKSELLKAYEDAEARLAEFTPGAAEVLVDADADQSTANVPLADFKQALADRDSKLAAYEAMED